MPTHEKHMMPKMPKHKPMPKAMPPKKMPMKPKNK